MFNTKCRGCCIGNTIANILLIIGGLNWGLVGVGMIMNGNWNVVNIIFGSLPIVEAIIYVLVGLAAIMKIFGCCCKKCKEAQATCCAAENTDQKM
ncbi:MAG: DUF378 domain-containing protein [Candidatus Paceibacterota bacterium]